MDGTERCFIQFDNILLQRNLWQLVLRGSLDGHNSPKLSRKERYLQGELHVENVICASKIRPKLCITKLCITWFGSFWAEGVLLFWWRAISAWILRNPKHVQDDGEGGLSLRGVAVITETAITTETAKTVKPPRLPHCAVFCRTSKRRVRCSPEPPNPWKPPKPSWRPPPLNSTPLFRHPDMWLISRWMLVCKTGGVEQRSQKFYRINVFRARSL